MKPTKTWVLIADGARARVLENLGPGKGVHEVPGHTYSAAHPANRDILADRPSRAFDSTGDSRHAIEPNVDPHREAKRGFARQLAAMLDTALADGACDRIVLVAPATTMGDLRHALSDRARNVLHGELVEDLTKMPDANVARHLESVLAV